MFDSELYRDKDEVKKWQEQGPIQRLRAWLHDNKLVNDQQLERMVDDINAEIEQAIQFSEQGEWEAVSDLYRDVYTPEAIS